MFDIKVPETTGKVKSYRYSPIWCIGRVEPSELVLCTYTEKAANEMKDRIAALAEKIHYEKDLSQLRVGTIHGICNQLITKYRHHTPLGNNYETLDDFSQLLFLFQHIDEVCKNGAIDYFKGKWGSTWDVAKELQRYFDKIIEELVDVDKLRASDRPFHKQLARVYHEYQKVLIRENRVSFAALLKIAYNLLNNSQISTKIAQGIKYVFVDEYQDTNYIQEQIVLKLASSRENLCVVGDEDQALYRFRGATVRNILEFSAKVPGCKSIQLTTNYRSHAKIIAAYDCWMASADWSNSDGQRSFRTEKSIKPHKGKEYPDYPAAFSIYGVNPEDEAAQFAELVLDLRKRGVISDYSQVALLLYSVRPCYSDVYVKALEEKKIPVFCPRARSYFDQKEVRLMMGCFAKLFGYYGETQDDLLSHQYFSKYIKECLQELNDSYKPSHPLYGKLQELEVDIVRSKEAQDEEFTTSPANCFYQLLAVDPFVTFVQNERQMRNLVIFSKVLNTFQNFYRHINVAQHNLKQVKSDFFDVFMRLQQESGLNEFEDAEQPFPKGYLQIMTIHQSKGLEFPVVAVGSLDIKHTGSAEVDRELQDFYHRRDPFEPEKRIPGFDVMRLHYVAFSRAEKLLVLTAHKPPRSHFDTIWQRLPRWSNLRRDLLEMASSKPKGQMLLKAHYNFTGHIKMYETCPRQYQFFRDYTFVPSRPKEVFLGLLVHQTIEDIHRLALDGKFAKLNESKLRDIFERTFSCLLHTNMHPIDPITKEQAFSQVLNYFMQNQREIQRAIETEVDIALEKDGYVLTGRVDLLMERNGKLELLDFKTARRPSDMTDLLVDYQQQLYTYAYVLQQRYKKPLERLFLYWTEEPCKENALMELPYRPEMLENVGHYFDTIVGKIKGKDYRIVTLPERRICKQCDIQHFCVNDRTIEPFAKIDELVSIVPCERFNS